MAIYRLIANGSFGPDEIKVMTNAYEDALIDLRVPNRLEAAKPLPPEKRGLFLQRINAMLRYWGRTRNDTRPNASGVVLHSPSFIRTR